MDQFAGGAYFLVIFIFSIAILILGILAILMPIFVIQIRNSLHRIESMLSEQIPPNAETGPAIKTEKASLDWSIKTCRSCGAKNVSDATDCASCQKPLE